MWKLSTQWYLGSSAVEPRPVGPLTAAGVKHGVMRGGQHRLVAGQLPETCQKGRAHRVRVVNRRLSVGHVAEAAPGVGALDGQSSGSRNRCFLRSSDTAGPSAPRTLRGRPDRSARSRSAAAPHGVAGRFSSRIHTDRPSRSRRNPEPGARPATRDSFWLHPKSAGMPLHCGSSPGNPTPCSLCQSPIREATPQREA